MLMLSALLCMGMNIAVSGADQAQGPIYFKLRFGIKTSRRCLNNNNKMR